jgi:hypothetical protein
MPRKQGESTVKPAGSAITRMTRMLTSKAKLRTGAVAVAEATKPQASAEAAGAGRRESDVAPDPGQTYMPAQTSIKTSLRSDGADHQNDQDLTPGAGERWQNEDHFTNKSGNARIGTHGRSGEPGDQPTTTTNENRR